MNKLRCIAVDDEPLALSIVSGYAEKVSFLELVQTFTNPLAALEYVRNNPVDIVFLDIQMPEISGLHLTELLRTSTNVIFTTAYKKYAIEAYDLDAADYLVKPFSFERFLKSVMKVATAKAKGTPPQPEADSLAENKFKTLYVKTDKKIVRLSTRNLYYIQGLKDYVILMTSAGKLIARESIKNLEAMLDDDMFIRVHKSYVVGLNHIDFIEGNVVHIEGSSIPIGSSYRTILLSRLDKGMIGKRLD